MTRDHHACLPSKLVRLLQDKSLNSKVSVMQLAAYIEGAHITI